jgi:hypothetical protein
VIQERSAAVRVCVYAIYAIQLFGSNLSHHQSVLAHSEFSKHTGVKLRRRNSSARQPHAIQIHNEFSHLSAQEHINLVGEVVQESRCDIIFNVYLSKREGDVGIPFHV